MVSVLHKELEYKVEKLKYKKVGGHAVEDQKQIRASRVNKRPSWISPYEVLQLWLIDTVYHLSVKNNKNNKGDGMEDLKERGDLLTFFPWKGVGRGLGA